MDGDLEKRSGKRQMYGVALLLPEDLGLELGVTSS
jgi:hypothetical protein